MDLITLAILEGQTLTEATHNVPWWQTEVENETRVIYPPEAKPLEVDKPYIWQVQAFDALGYPLGRDEGKSGINRFMVLPYVIRSDTLAR